MFQNIPAEMKAFRQWIVWRYEESKTGKSTKIPYNAATGWPASVTDERSWTTFEAAVAAAPRFSGIGFVLTKNDPFGFIDLDSTEKEKDPDAAMKRQLDIFHKFDSYSERSPSGKGLHIIVKGNIPAGRRRSSIEIYSSERYMTMTGDVFNDKPVIDRQFLFGLLYDEMGKGASVDFYKGDLPQKYSDEEIIRQAGDAHNGDKFTALHEGRWQEHYATQSEADFAYIDILAFYSQNKEQLLRIMKASPLGARNKKTTIRGVDYYEHMILRSFDRMLPPVDIEDLKAQLELAFHEKNAASKPSNEAAEVQGKPQQAPPGASAQPLLPHIDRSVKPVHLRTRPPGLLGEIASFIYDAAPRAVPEAALVGAIGLMSGICGRAYNVGNAGLNQYVLLIAQTGIGKEAIAAGIDTLMNSIKLSVPASASFVGPSHIASGQALLKTLSNSSACFVSILGEFGLLLRRLSSPYANPNDTLLKQVLLDLYNKSGGTRILRASAYSQKENNIPELRSPAFSIIGESSPTRFYENIDESTIEEGLLPRITVIEYHGERPPFNENAASVQPSMALVEQLGQLCAHSHMLMHGQKTIDVTFEPEAHEIDREFDKFCDKQINEAQKESIRQLWNRAHIKVRKLAALAAIGENFYSPKITAQNFDWAKSIVITDIWSMLRKFEFGFVGERIEENSQEREMTRVIKEFVSEASKEYPEKYMISRTLWEMKIVPYAYLSRRLMTNSVFQRDRIGSTGAIKRTIALLLEKDILRELRKVELSEKYGTTQRCFVISDAKAVLNE